MLLLLTACGPQHVAYEAGAFVPRFAMPAIDERGTVYNRDGSSSYHSTSPASGEMSAIGLTQRIGMRGLHDAIGLEMGGAWALSSPALATTLANGTPSTEHGGALFDVTVVPGLHTKVGSFELGAELPVGLRFAGIGGTLPDGYTRCAGGGSGKGCGFFATETQALALLRGRIDAWIDPHVTLGVVAGVDLVGAGETFSLVVGFHSMMFDGQ